MEERHVGRPDRMSRERILYVDDDEALAEMVRETLEHRGYEVVTDADTEKVLRAFSKDPNSCDLAILDHLLPRMEGVELAQWLLLNRPDLPVILVTGYPDLVSPKEAECAEVREVLFKPLSRPELFAAIDRVLSSTPASSRTTPPATGP